jgi:UDP-N-acetylglucosamine diphosphorylase/glucosamine-1-phosphate N-acetyltransferase
MTESLKAERKQLKKKGSHNQTYRGCNKLKTIVLAAGEGVRLQPITSTRPKHLIKICGKPILEHVLNTLKTSGLDDILIVTHYKEEQIRRYFEDGKKFGLNINYVQQKDMLGTGDALKTVEPYVTGDFLLIYGDLLFSTEAIKRITDKNQQTKATLTLGCVPVQNPEEYGIVEADKEGNVKRIIEKPRKEEAPSNLANAGIYIFSSEIFEKMRIAKSSVRGEWEIPDAISLMLKEGKRVTEAELPSSEWMDIGRPWDLLKANQWILARADHKMYGLIEDGAHLIGPISVAETARIRSGAYVEGPVFIDEASDIGPNCYIRPYTSVGRKVRIGNACEVKNTILMDNVHVGHLSYLGDSIIGEGCNLGAGTITANYRFDAGVVRMHIKNKMVDSGMKKLGAILGDNVKTGINSLFMPGTKVGQDTWVGPDVLVQRDLPARSRILLKQNVETTQSDK